MLDPMQGGGVAVHVGNGERLGACEGSSARTRKSTLTRRRILAAAGELMVERGGTAFRMGEVSERCHLSKGALYYYFADRDELIEALFDESVDDLVDGIEAATACATSARDALSRLYEELVRRLRAGGPLTLALTHEVAQSGGLPMPGMQGRLVRVRKAVASQLERAKDEGLVSPEVDCALAATYAIGGLIAISLEPAGVKAGEDLDVMAARLLDLVLGGIAADGVVREG